MFNLRRSISFIRWLPLLAALLLLSLALIPGSSVSAQVFTPGCNVANLVANIATAGSNGQADTINLQSGCTYTLTAQLIINADSGFQLDIVGNGAIISGNASVRVLNVNSGAFVAINNVTLTNGNSCGICNLGNLTLTNVTVSSHPGGGIHNSGTLVMNSTSITGNSSSAFSGGGIINFDGATASISSSNISANSTPNGGGGISNEGTMTLTSSIVSSNSTDSWGGGIANQSTGTLTLNSSTISGNSATGSGAGIFNNYGTLTLNRSTISANNADDAGGGIYTDGPLTLTNSTISGNSAGGNGGGIVGFDGSITLNNSTVSGNTTGGAGGGILSYNNLTLKNTILANSNAGVDCLIAAGTTDITYSLIEDGGCGITNGVNGNKTGDPNLGALTGSPAYHPLNAGSIAINAGSNALIPGGVTTDQPGNARIQGGTVDMGSFESAPPATNTPTRTHTRTYTPTPGTSTTTPPAPNVNLVVNGTFDSTFGPTYRWTFYSATQTVTAGQLNVAPTAAGGGFYQQINYGSGGEIFEVNFQARNSSMTQKTVNVIVRDTDYNPSYNCVFGMTANTPFQYYRMRFDTSEGFMPMMLQFALTGDSTLGLVIDNITMVRKTGISVPTTECTVSPPANTELIFNGAFNAGTGSWAAFNATMNSVNIGGANGSIMQIGRNSGTTFGGFYQYSPYSAPTNAVFQFSFQIGNQSAQARVINMLVRSEDWVDMHSCFITVPANTPLTTQTILLKTTKAWSNIVIQGWIQVGDYVSGPPPFRFDNISLQYLPSSGYSGSTQCPAPLPMPQRVTDTPTPTITPSLTPSLTATYTATATATSTETALPSATATASETPTDVPTVEPPTLTPILTDTATDIPTLIPEPPSPTPEPPTAEPPSATPEPPTSTPETPPEETPGS
jgi:hypothetical protein